MEESNEAIEQRTSQQNHLPSNNIEEFNEESAERTSQQSNLPSCNTEESNEEIADLVGTVKEAEDSNISPCTRRIYINKLIEIMTHIFDTSQCKLGKELASIATMVSKQTSIRHVTSNFIANTK